MKQKHKILTTVVVLLVIISTLTVAFANQENEFDFPHEHNYQITAFADGVVTFTCEICEENYQENFAEHLNDCGYAPLDMNGDGIVNAKDYAYLIRKYS